MEGKTSLLRDFLASCNRDPVYRDLAPRASVRRFPKQSSGPTAAEALARETTNNSTRLRHRAGR